VSGDGCFISEGDVKMEVVVGGNHLKGLETISKVNSTRKKELLFVSDRLVEDWNIKFGSRYYKQTSRSCSVPFPCTRRIIFKPSIYTYIDQHRYMLAKKLHPHLRMVTFTDK
jgi:hypothetical protein